MKKVIGLFLAASMLLGAYGSNAFAKKDANDSVIGYQMIDFENYSVGDNLITNGTSSADGLFDVGTTDGEYYTIVNENGGKALRIHTNASVQGMYVSAYNHASGITSDDIDYYVCSYDFRNGSATENPFRAMGILRMTMREDSGTEIYHWGQGWACKSDVTTYKYPVAKTWQNFTLVYDRANCLMYVAVDGVVTGMKFYDTGINADAFFRLQWNSMYSSGSDEETCYIDNIEMYGVDADANTNVCSLVQDASNDKVINATFNHAVDMTSANVSATNDAEISSVAYADGKYVITLASIPAAGTKVTVSGVKDIFGTACENTTIDIAAPEVKEVKYGYEKIDFEKYTVGDSIITNGNSTADGLIDVGVTSGETYTVVEANGSKALKIQTEDGVSGGYISAFNNTTEITDSDIDYYVCSYDFRNGSETENPFGAMGILRFTIREDSGEQLYNWGMGYSLKSSTSTYKYPAAKTWVNHTLIYERATGNLYVVVDGVITGMVYNNANQSASDFFRLQWCSDYNSGNLVKTAYLDNIELYGLKSEEMPVKATLTAPTDDTYTVKVEFTHPVEFSADNISGVAVDSVKLVDGVYEIVPSGLKSNTEYTMTISGVKDVYGQTADTKTVTFTTGKIAAITTYLSTDARFTGKDDFEGYSGVGIIESATSATTTITKNGYKIDDIYPTSTGNAGGVEYSLVEEATGNKAFKVSIPGEAASSEYTTIFQPKPDANWTSAAAGKYFVYKIDFKSGSDDEAAFYTQPFGMDGAYANIYFANGFIDYNGVKAYFDASEWNNLEYVVDCTGDAAEISVILNGKLISTTELASYEVKNSAPRFAVAYPVSGAVDSSLYYDNLEIYTITELDLPAAVPSYTISNKGSVQKDDADAGIFYTVKLSEVNDDVTLGIADHTFTITDLGSFDVNTSLTYVLLGNNVPSVNSDIKIKSGGTTYAVK